MVHGWKHVCGQLHCVMAQNSQSLQWIQRLLDGDGIRDMREMDADSECKLELHNVMQPDRGIGLRLVYHDANVLHADNGIGLGPLN